MTRQTHVTMKKFDSSRARVAGSRTMLHKKESCLCSVLLLFIIHTFMVAACVFVGMQMHAIATRQIGAVSFIIHISGKKDPRDDIQVKWQNYIRTGPQSSNVTRMMMMKTSGSCFRVIAPRSIRLHNRRTTSRRQRVTSVVVNTTGHLFRIIS